MESPEAFQSVVGEAAFVHDLGKLDGQNQAILASSGRARLPVNHVDAGVAALLRRNQIEAALVAYSHHRGLPSLAAELAKPKGSAFRDADLKVETDARLKEYLSIHLAETGHQPSEAEAARPRSGLWKRMALSCLVDADHSDTARFYGWKSAEPSQPRWGERLAALDAYVARLGRESDSERRGLRSALYQACRRGRPEEIAYLDAPVGTGKTTAVMAYLLRLASERKLRHIFCVLPYTNIIDQSVAVYREALTLPGEHPEGTVAAHHHQVDFESPELRGLAMLWDAPITVTTAVQFFETIAGHRTGKLRKLHELAGSAVCVDESHAAVPTPLWPQTWKWMRELTSKWGCHFVLASGSLSRFWEHDEFRGDASPLLDSALRDRLYAAEKRRLSFRRAQKIFDRRALCQAANAVPGPRLVVMNTVQSAAVAALVMRHSGEDVLHLSTSLAPQDRMPILDLIRRRLTNPNDTDWTLVATSCVEAGIDLSFRTAFRESCSASSLVQVGGRVNRHAEHADADMWDFRTIDSYFRQNPAFEPSRSVLAELWKEGLVNELPPGELATEALRRELLGGFATKARRIASAESCGDYPEVAKLFRLIDSETTLVAVDPSLIERLESGESVEPLHLVGGSVRIRTSRLKSFPTEPLDDQEELHLWRGEYDSSFLGYMAEVASRAV